MTPLRKTIKLTDANIKKSLQRHSSVRPPGRLFSIPGRQAVRTPRLRFTVYQNSKPRGAFPWDPCQRSATWAPHDININIKTKNIYIYIYIERERERKRENIWSFGKLPMNSVGDLESFPLL